MSKRSFFTYIQLTVDVVTLYSLSVEQGVLRHWTWGKGGRRWGELSGNMSRGNVQSDSRPRPYMVMISAKSLTDRQVNAKTDTESDETSSDDEPYNSIIDTYVCIDKIWRRSAITPRGGRRENTILAKVKWTFGNSKYSSQGTHYSWQNSSFVFNMIISEFKRIV